jgi:hypothetical protein
MIKLIFTLALLLVIELLFLCSWSLLSHVDAMAQTPTPKLAIEVHSFEVVANSGSRFTVIKEFFSQPFTKMPKRACTVEFTKPGIQRPHEHGEGELQDYSLMWVQILAEVGEKVTYTCKGER